MNEDEKFFSQFHEAPRPEFAAAVYKRITKPMNTHRISFSLRKAALTFASACVLLIAGLLAYPPTRAMALNWLRQIGVFIVTTAQPDETQPTALPPDASQKPLTAASASEASRLAGFQVLSPAALPDGYSAEGAFSIQPNGNGKVVVTLYANPARGTYILLNQYRYGTGDSFTDNVNGQETVEDVQVRGNGGVWIAGRLVTSPIDVGTPGQVEPHASNWLRWEENAIVYTLISDGLAQAEMLKLADSLK